ncbi:MULTISPECIES: SAM-dependent methyltransferase [Streptomyces]|uniref:SAM-dependent methyltransferase n=1 Tax=Streptomyces caniscabiei TaxID=2746961 RepID=A0ABU4MPA3_9ACTN|nr:MULTISPECIES: SAM-dependent methyltransferase [Streptomyces]MBE4733738.1 SAM-dependent methyltransferase [Streptomyces caniscabiei]MBE4754915.1 SAM-dependent methyltransferase [Streptomyces caniscabiei]MBE4768265.1 SAM-dependent methyltransferase [Streptomyces caniscabiei]MBE4782233.1 SAM-dependent methyltransferase [Streptomyces caniscabiei]MBE4793521.1 SAM-dependent methyltransferase [Streptomyces caniscabiei]
MTDHATTPGPAAHQKIDTSVPHSARIWNYWLGGKDNYPVDEQAGDAYTAVFPGIVTIARGSRAFLRRTITHLVTEAGIRQFLDVGTGLPTAENTHEVAQRIAPESRIVYVDNDPLVLAHARALLYSTPEGATAYVDADVLDPDRILAAAADTLDLKRPTALILSNILGHVADHDQARSVVDSLMGALPAGSYLAVNDGSRGIDPVFERAQDSYNESGAVPYNLRTVDEITSFFDGLELLDPGVVSVPLWRPDTTDPAPEVVAEHGGLARKR